VHVSDFARLGNCATDDVTRLLRTRREEFIGQEEATFLALA
jgi:hypothetical protein